MKLCCLFLGGLALLGGLLLAGGCFSDDVFDHSPPAGQGSVVVDNRTGRDLNVFIGGIQVERVGARRWRAYDRDPGVYRVVLEERNGIRNFRDDVDVLDGRLTVLDATIDTQRREGLSVYIYFD